MMAEYVQRQEVIQDVPREINFSLAEEIFRETGNPVLSCFQCRKCTNGCPLTFAMDYYPDQIIRLIILGQEEEALRSRTIWVCSSCETCTTRCPNGIDIAGVMDYLKQKAHKQAVVSHKDNWSYAFHRVFFENMLKNGRVHEPKILADYLLRSGAWKQKLESGSLWRDVKLGLFLLRNRRMRLFPSRVNINGHTVGTEAH
ncbi:MAG: 4Fe-4S dicluster domain-containing protein [Syntrophobacterales bacterium]|nr:4Fe-4S dicluster domain-containing protein [Syntrophobacterales bacterium]